MKVKQTVEDYPQLTGKEETKQIREKHAVTHYYVKYFSESTLTHNNTNILKMYDLSFRVNLVYKPKTIWFWIKKLFNKILKHMKKQNKPV
jgi:hypothetical protein